MSIRGELGASSTDVIPSRSGAGSTALVDYSLKESNRSLILERKKIQLYSDKATGYSSARNDTISFNISPGAGDEWLDGRSSYITANIQLSGTGVGNLYLPNGPASCFNQVQIISASGQQLVNILDYGTIQQMFTEWTTCPTWKAGAGQMYGTGEDSLGQWEPARYTPSFCANTAGTPAPAIYSPFEGKVATATYNTVAVPDAAPGLTAAPAGAVTNLVLVNQKPAGSALQLQKNLATTGLTGGITVAFRLDLAWIFGNPTLIPSQFFPLTLRCTLDDPRRSLTYVGIPITGDTLGPYSTAPTGVPLPGIVAETTALANLDITWQTVRFNASLCKVSPGFKSQVDEAMSRGAFNLTVTNYYTSGNNIASGGNAVINSTFSAHDCQAFWVNLVPSAHERDVKFDNAWKFGGQLNNTTWATGVYLASNQLMLNGRYWPLQPNATQVDMYHDTLASFNIGSENVTFSPVSFHRYNTKSFVVGYLFDRDPSSSLTGVNSVASPVWTWTGTFSANVPEPMTVHTCIAYTQVLKVQRDGQIQIFQ